MKRTQAIAALGAAGVLAGCASSAVGGHGSAAGSPPARATSVTSASAPPSSTAAAPSSSPARPATTAAPPSASAPASSSAPPAGLIGQWDGHGRHLVIRADGTVVVNFRTYVDCTSTVTTGCDRVIGNEIHDGGHVLGHITKVVNATTVIVTVASTTDPAAIPAGPVRLGHDLTHHAVALFAGDFNGVPFCSAESPSGYCGA